MKERSRHPKLSRERVLDIALIVIDRDGIERLSMRKLGSELGIEAMTLYYYFPNKDAILDGLVERVTLLSQEVSLAELSAWPDMLRALAISFHRELLRHPRLVPLIATRPVMTPDSLRAVESIVAVLCATGFSPLGAFQVINTITTFVIGHTLAEAGDTPGHEDAAPDFTNFAAMLDPDAFPYFTQALHAGLGQPSDHESRFHFALDALLIGITFKHSQERDL